MKKLNIDEQQVLDLYKQYKTAREVAAIVGCSDQTIYRILAKHGVPRTNRQGSKTPPKWTRPSNCNTKYCPALIAILTATGMSAREVSDLTGIPIQSVGNVLTRKYPHLKKRRVYQTGVDMDAIEAEYLTGASCRELGEKYGVNPATISKWMRGRGHHRGKWSGPAFERANAQKRIEADARIAAEFPQKVKTGKKSRKYRRELRMAQRRHDHGITWQRIAERKGDLICEVCGHECDPNDKRWGTSGPTHPSVDHIVRLIDGGTDTWDNVRLVCHQCNMDLHIQRNKELQNA